MRMMSVALASATIVSGCATSFGPAVCASVLRTNDVPFARFEVLSPMDMGNGRVLTQSNTTVRANQDSQQFVDRATLTDCDTGEQLMLVRARRVGGAETLVDRRANVRQTLNDAARGSMAQVQARAAALDVPFETSITNTETCGCNALYPELPGTKTEYEGTR